MKRAVRSQVPVLRTPGLFGGLSETLLVRNLLQNPKSLKEYPFVEVYRRLVAQRGAAAPRSAGPTVVNTRSFTPSEAARALMTQSAVTTKHLDRFLETNYVSESSPVERRDALDRGLFDLVAASTPNNLRTMMQYLSRYWQCGLFGSRPLIRSARSQARFVLERALVVHPATQHANGGEQVGVPDMQKFETFVANFFDYLGVQHLPEDELEELLLRLSSQSGTLAAAMTQMLSVPHGKLSEETMQQFLTTYAASKPSRKSVEALKGALLNQQTGPSAVKFLLPYAESAAEVLDLLEFVDRSASKVLVYEQCSHIILDRLLHLSGDSNSVGLIFAYVNRARTAVNNELALVDTLNLALRMVLLGGNNSAVNQAIKLVDGKPVDAALLSQCRKRLASYSDN